jgi:hypothetical protein
MALLNPIYLKSPLFDYKTYNTYFEDQTVQYLEKMKYYIIAGEVIDLHGSI